MLSLDDAVSPSSTTQCKQSSPGRAAMGTPLHQEIDQQPDGKESISATVTRLPSYQHIGLSEVMKMDAFNCNDDKPWSVVIVTWEVSAGTMDHSICHMNTIEQDERAYILGERYLYRHGHYWSMYSNQITEQPFWIWVIMRRQPRIQWHNDDLRPVLFDLALTLLYSLEIYPHYHVLYAPRFPLNEEWECRIIISYVQDMDHVVSFWIGGDLVIVE